MSFFKKLKARFTKEGALDTSPKTDEPLIPIYIPALGAVLIRAEDLKGGPLSREQVLKIRDEATVMMMPAAAKGRMDDSRGYADIDPDKCWYDWQMLRRELGRKPDLEAGGRQNFIKSSEEAFQQTITAAKATLPKFREMFDSAPGKIIMIKTEFIAEDGKTYLWLNAVKKRGQDFSVQVFEHIPGLEHLPLYEDIYVKRGDIVDWMVNDNGVVSGGFSLRYVRDKKPVEDRAEYDAYIA